MLDRRRQVTGSNMNGRAHNAQHGVCLRGKSRPLVKKDQSACWLHSEQVKYSRIVEICASAVARTAEKHSFCALLSQTLQSIN